MSSAAFGPYFSFSFLILRRTLLGDECLVFSRRQSPPRVSSRLQVTSELSVIYSFSSNLPLTAGERLRPLNITSSPGSITVPQTVCVFVVSHDIGYTRWMRPL